MDTLSNIFIYCFVLSVRFLKDKVSTHSLLQNDVDWSYMTKKYNPSVVSTSLLKTPVIFNIFVIFYKTWRFLQKKTDRSKILCAFQKRT